jgi:hypothetical protein
VEKLNSVLIGGWATYLLINDIFKRERKRDYVGSKDIDIAVLSSDLLKAFEIAERLGFSPLSFRYCKIYVRSEKRFINESEAKNYPIHELFYLFLDFITDRRLDVKMTVFEDDLIGFAFENGLFLKRKGFRVVAPELLVLSKMRMLPGRDEEKRLKDMLDASMVFTFHEEFEIRLFRELSKRFRFDKDLVKKELKRARESLSLLGFSEAEATNILASFGSLLTQA